jgi:hypothetical protein
MENEVANALAPVNAELDKLRAELAGALQRLAVLDGKTDQPSTPEDTRERLQRERDERTKSNELERYASDNRREGDARPLSKHRREELGARRSANLPGAALPQPSGKGKPAATDPMMFFVVHKGKLKKINLLKDGGLVEVKKP